MTIALNKHEVKGFICTDHSCGKIHKLYDELAYNHALLIFSGKSEVFSFRPQTKEEQYITSAVTVAELTTRIDIVCTKTKPIWCPRDFLGEYKPGNCWTKYLLGGCGSCMTPKLIQGCGNITQITQTH